MQLIHSCSSFFPPSQGEEKDGDAEGEDSDEDDGFFVPHGYLSNDEGDSSDCGEFITDPNEDVRSCHHQITTNQLMFVFSDLRAKGESSWRKPGRQSLLGSVNPWRQRSLVASGLLRVRGRSSPIRIPPFSCNLPQCHSFLFQYLLHRSPPKVKPVLRKWRTKEVSSFVLQCNEISFALQGYAVMLSRRNN